MCRLGNMLCTTTKKVTTGQTPDKVIPMCRYTSQATQKLHPYVSEQLPNHVHLPTIITWPPNHIFSENHLQTFSKDQHSSKEDINIIPDKGLCKTKGKLLCIQEVLILKVLLDFHFSISKSGIPFL